jgi:putative tricarboxylic transport membrane protein
LIRNGLRHGADVRWFERGEWTRHPRQVVALAVTLGALLLYVVASERIGFLLTALLMLVAMMRALHVRWGATLLVAAVATVAIHAAFYKGLRVPLPWGVLPVLY